MARAEREEKAREERFRKLYEDHQPPANLSQEEIELILTPTIRGWIPKAPWEPSFAQKTAAYYGDASFKGVPRER